MTWLKLSDDFADSCADAELSDRAFRTHVEALIWSMRRETGGFMTVRDLKRGCEYADDVTVRELVNAGFWDLVPDEGWQILHHMEHQPEPDLIRKRRDSTAERVRRHRRRKAGLEDGDDEEGNAVAQRVTDKASNVVSLGNAVAQRVPRDGSGRSGTGTALTAFAEERSQTSSIDRRSTLRANRPPGTLDGEILNPKATGETVEERAHRLVGDVLGKTIQDVRSYIDGAGDEVTDENIDRWGLDAFVCETLVPALVSGSSDNTVRAELRKARDAGDITDAMFYTNGDDWRDGTGGWG